MNQEDAFTEEAQEEILDHESRRRQTSQKISAQIRTSEDIWDEENHESSPLISSSEPARAQRQPHLRGHSYHKAINEPWTGAHGSRDLPWYKKPSVSTKTHTETHS